MMNVMYFSMLISDKIFRIGRRRRLDAMILLIFEEWINLKIRIQKF